MENFVERQDDGYNVKGRPVPDSEDKKPLVSPKKYD